MPKDTKSLGNNKAPACESRGFVRKKKKVCFFDTPSHIKQNVGRFGRNAQANLNPHGYD